MRLLILLLLIVLASAHRVTKSPTPHHRKSTSSPLHKQSRAPTPFPQSPVPAPTHLPSAAPEAAPTSSPVPVTPTPTAAPVSYYYNPPTAPTVNELLYRAGLYYEKAAFNYAIAAKEKGYYQQVDLANARADEAYAKKLVKEAEE